MTTQRDRTNGSPAREKQRAALELWAALTCLTGAVESQLAAHLEARAGVLPEEADLLALLFEAPEQRLRMADVSAALRLSKSGVTRLVDRLGARGLVVRAPCPKDRRVIYAGLTDAGRAAAGVAIPARATGLAQVLAGRLSAKELEGLTATLRRLAPVADRPAPAADADA
jgi:DNA-binding MarR family transcriptional regulator